ncbi:MAG: hypothetical protein ACD_3C00058G0011 [uncultured bacterium (gcode 4)]|uniref:Uncharacterized protein n=1 Tax=uncultured bacterium (gcode 4) TaxID=1234023 RepID=K2GY96_9BACT|nr:MAG: hypothetical protein ACD_3C00058G0011 [uncultured bacterium (gcode 4)]
MTFVHYIEYVTYSKFYYLRHKMPDLSIHLHYYQNTHKIRTYTRS